MFFGAVPVQCIEQIVKLVPFDQWTAAYTCCSGSFRIEKALASKFPALPIHGNDVALYSTAIGRAAMAQPMRIEFRGELEYVEEVLAGRDGGFLDRAAAVLVACEIARFRGKSLYAKRMRAWWRAHFAAMLDKAVAKLSKTIAGIRLASYSPIDWRLHVDNAIAAGAGIAAFPPFFKGDYESQYRFVDQNVAWDEPSYDLYDPRTLGSIIDRIDAAGVPYIVLSDQIFPNRKPVMEYVTGRKVPHYAYANVADSSVRHVHRAPELFRYRPFEIEAASARSKVRVTWAGADQCDFIKDVYLAKTIRHTQGAWHFFVWVDDMLAGCIIYSLGKYGPKGTNPLYLLSDVTTAREGRISKLVATIATSQTVIAEINRRCLDRFDYVLTTARTKNPVSMKYRGIYELLTRRPSDDPEEGNIINYGSAIRKERPSSSTTSGGESIAKPEPLRTEVRRGDPRRLRLLEKNARYMTEPQMKRLVENVRRDGVLTSMPLVYVHEDGAEEVLSGNHRVQAAIIAEIPEVDYIAILTPIPEERRVAIQLSHNSIAGQDDPNILLELYAALDLGEKLYSGVTDDMLKLLPEIDIDGMSIGQPKMQEIKLLFLAEEERPFLDLAAQLNDRKAAPPTLLARLEAFDHLFDTIVAVKRRENIKNTALAIERMVELARERMDELAPPADEA